MTLWIDEKYLLEISSTLDQFKKKRTGLYNCRCPLCGDSEKSKIKARGYFYEKQGKMLYACKNCGAGTTFGSFLRDYDPHVYKQYNLENFKEEHGTKTKEKPKLKYKFVKKFENSPDVLKGIKRCSALPDDHIAVKYLDNRRIPKEFYSRLYYVDRLEDVSRRIEKYAGEKYDDTPRIIIPSFNEKKELTHLACRALGKSSLRYMTLIVKEDAPKIFGLDRIDFDQTIYICEGQFDSMFIPNAVAAGGSDLDSIHIGNNVVFIFDNEPRSKEIMQKVGRLIDKGNAVVIWGRVNGKDINEMILNGHTQEELLQHIKDHTYSGAKAKIKFLEYKKRGI